MDTMQTTKEPVMKPAYVMLATAIRSYEPDRLSEEVVASLRFMLRSETFAPIKDIIADKLIDIGEYFRRKDERVVKTNLEGKPINRPTRTPDGRKRKKKATGNAPEGSTPGPSMSFVQDPNTGILLPVKE
jgi:hypothetical protein